MNEEEILKIVDNFIDGYRQYDTETGETIIPYKYGEGQKFVYKEDFEAMQGLLDLYNKEKEKNKELEKIIQILEAKPYTAYTLYGDILHESDEIAQMLKEVLEKE